MRRAIDPSRFIEDVATNASSSKRLQQMTDVEAVENWEDEGGAFSYTGESIVAGEQERLDVLLALLVPRAAGAAAISPLVRREEDRYPISL